MLGPVASSASEPQMKVLQVTQFAVCRASRVRCPTAHQHCRQRPGHRCCEERRAMSRRFHLSSQRLPRLDSKVAPRWVLARCQVQLPQQACSLSAPWCPQALIQSRPAGRSTWLACASRPEDRRALCLPWHLGRWSRQTHWHDRICPLVVSQSGRPWLACRPVPPKP